MEEESKTQTPQENAPKKANPMIFIGAGLVVLLAIGAFFFSQKREASPSEEMTENGQMAQGSTAEENSESTGEAMNEGDNQVKNSSPTAMTDTKTTGDNMANVVDVKVEGGMYYFKPNTITVKKGQTVKITLTSAEGMHDFVIDELNIKTNRVQTGQSTTVEFTPDKTGSFEFYCSVANHKALGMKGTLIVE